MEWKQLEDFHKILGKSDNGSDWVTFGWDIQYVFSKCNQHNFLIDLICEVKKGKYRMITVFAWAMREQTYYKKMKNTGPEIGLRGPEAIEQEFCFSILTQEFGSWGEFNSGKSI